MTCVRLMEIFFIVIHFVDDRGRTTTTTFGSGCTPPVDGVLIQILSLYCIRKPIRTDLFWPTNNEWPNVYWCLEIQLNVMNHWLLEFSAKINNNWSSMIWNTVRDVIGAKPSWHLAIKTNLFSPECFKKRSKITYFRLIIIDKRSLIEICRYMKNWKKCLSHLTLPVPLQELHKVCVRGPATPGVVQDSHNFVHDVVYVEPSCYSPQRLLAHH